MTKKKGEKSKKIERKILTPFGYDSKENTIVFKEEVEKVDETEIKKFEDGLNAAYKMNPGAFKPKKLQDFFDKKVVFSEDTDGNIKTLQKKTFAQELKEGKMKKVNKHIKNMTVSISGTTDDESGKPIAFMLGDDNSCKKV